MQELCLYPDYSPELEEVPPTECEPEALVSEIKPTFDIGRRRRREWRASAIAFGLAIAVHAAVIAVGLLYYKSASHYQAPQLVLPQGWATEFDGAGDAGAPVLLKPALQLYIPKPDASATDADVLPPLASDVEPPAVTPPAVALDASSGTSESAALPSLAGDSTPPLVNFRSPPGFDAGRGELIEARNINNDAALAAVGSAAMGNGRGDGGGRQGVPDGQPIPSSRNKHPSYPAIAQRNSWTGTTHLELDLDLSGRVTEVRLVQSSGHEVLDRAAIEVARTWTFSPALLDGQPVLTTVPVRIPFTLR